MHCALILIILELVPVTIESIGCLGVPDCLSAFYFGQEMTCSGKFLTNVRACAEKARWSKILIGYLQLVLSAPNNDYSHRNA